MKLPRLRRPRRRRTVVALVVAGAIGLALAVLVVVTRPAGVHTVSRFVAGTPESDGRLVQLDTTLYLPASTPAPAILLAHGFGGDKTDLDTQARDLARAGYVVLTYSARGFGKSGGLVHLDAPAFEVADASKLVDYLATQVSVRKDRDGDPRIGVAGSSYGGGLALLLAGTDHRIDAVGADITWRRPDRECSRNSGPVICSRPRTAVGRPIRAAGGLLRMSAPPTSARRRAVLPMQP
jgi:ABC-2 type transport system ATP-binding protein